MDLHALTIQKKHGRATLCRSRDLGLGQTVGGFATGLKGRSQALHCPARRRWDPAAEARVATTQAGRACVGRRRPSSGAQCQHTSRLSVALVTILNWLSNAACASFLPGVWDATGSHTAMYNFALKSQCIVFRAPDCKTRN